MALELKLSQKLSQSLIMTPQLQQAIKLLQLGRSEYLEVLEKELLENPFLEDGGEEDRGASISKSATELLLPTNSPNDELTASATAIPENATLLSGSEMSQERLTGELLEYFHLYGESGDGGQWSGNFSEELPSLEATVGNPEGLASHLLWQLRTTDLASEDYHIAAQIIGNLDRDGYLTCSVAELAMLCGQPEEEIERVLAVVQLLDPIGIAARDLQECLLIQLNQLGLQDSLSARIVRTHLKSLELQRFDTIAKQEGVSLETVYEAVRAIRKLEPRPGRPFVEEPPVYITPDVYVRKVGDDYVVTLNETGMPRLRLSSQYRDLLESNGNQNKNMPEREYLQDRMRSAAWFVRSIHQRQQTIFKVTQSIVKFQREFLEHGVSMLKPLVLRDVADDVGMHESTVSRVTTNKYVHTPQGVFELKFFFTSGIKSETGEVSSESVKERIRELIAKEEPQKPLSDQALVSLLKGEGVDIARRTVAKYREMMNIGSSSRRKRVF